MARNRKRRSEGRPNGPGDGVLAEPGVRAASAAAGGGRPSSRGGGGGGSPAPLEHAAPEAEIVEAQLARGRAADAIAPGAGPEPEGDTYEDEFDDLADDDDADDEHADGGGAGGRGAGRGGWRGGREGPGGGSRPGAQGGGAVVPSPSSPPGARVVHFLQGSWRELQRVQWPDRPQVMQATGVVIGFVIIAGLFLGLSDFVSQRIVNFILK